MKKKRDSTIDNMRGIAMMCIVLAHCGAPLEVNNIRVCDVITLVFLSSYVINVNEIFNYQIYKQRVMKRIKRLLAPTFLFIIIMFCTQLIIYNVARRRDLISLSKVINSFLLCENSLGYVWIMKVYIVNYLFYPLRIIVLKKFKYMWQYIITISCLFAAYMECVHKYNSINSESYLLWILVEQWLL